MTKETPPPGDAARRRGRPQQFPDDPTPIETDVVGVRQRVSWLLATSRVLSPDRSLAQRDHFLQLLRAQGVVADSTRISRWESGGQLARDNVVGAYEQILGVPDKSFVALAANLRRAGGIEQDVQDLDADEDVLDELFEQAMHDTLTGAGWLSLAGRVTGFERFYLTPGVRTMLSDKLLMELQLAVGHAQITRTAAANLLMGNASSRRQMSRSLGTHILSSDAQVFRPAMLLLRHVDDDSVSDLALRLMSNERPMLARAASSVVAGKLSQGQYTEEALIAIERHILQGVSAPAHSSRVLDALDLVSRLPEHAYDRIRPHIADPQLQRRFQQVRETGELQQPVIARDVARDVARLAQVATTAPFAQEPDQMLIRLVREALFHARHVRRKHASQLLGASPYRAGITSACLRLAGDVSTFVAARAWDVLHRMGPNDHPDLVDIALGELRHEPQVRALIAIGATSGPLGDHHAKAVTETAWHGSPDVQHAATFALGMTGSTGLERLLEHSSAQQREAAAWWIRVGPAVTDQPTPDAQSD